MFFCNIALAEAPISNKRGVIDLESKLISIKDESARLNSKIGSLNTEINRIEKQQHKISKNIERSANLQKEIHSDTLSLLKLSKQRRNAVDPINLKLIQPTNWYIFILPIVTIFLVIFSTILSITTISIKSRESLAALDASNKTQYNINLENINSERERSRESIISGSRQNWINTLRNDISSILSSATKYKNSDETERKEIFNDMWLEYYKIQLLLNPNEVDHKNLISAIKLHLGSFNGENDIFIKEQDKLLAMAQKILKREWVRAREFE